MLNLYNLKILEVCLLLMLIYQQSNLLFLELLILLFFLIFPILLSFLPCYKKNRYQDNCFNLINFTILMCFFIEFCFLVIDPFLFGIRYYVDGNGIELF